MDDIQLIEVGKVKAGENDRTVFNPASIAELAESIAQHGLIQPITVRPAGDGFQIVAGERRYRAVVALDWSTIPAIVRTMTDLEASTIMLLENIQRADIDPIDEAQAYQKRIDQFNLTIPALADLAKVSDSKIRGRLALLKLIPDVQHLVRHGNMPLNFAAEMTVLDKNFQLIALRYFGQTKRPTIAEFRVLCSDLLNKQSQVSMFDMSDFMTKPIEDITAGLDFRPIKILRFAVLGIKITIEYQSPRLFSALRGITS